MVRTRRPIDASMTPAIADPGRAWSDRGDAPAPASPLRKARQGPYRRMRPGTGAAPRAETRAPRATRTFTAASATGSTSPSWPTSTTALCMTRCTTSRRCSWRTCGRCSWPPSRWPTMWSVASARPPAAVALADRRLRARTPRCRKSMGSQRRTSGALVCASAATWSRRFCATSSWPLAATLPRGLWSSCTSMWPLCSCRSLPGWA
jgi:hypothetical protein